MRNLTAAVRDCPLAPPGQASVCARALHRACVILGGVEQLAAHLDLEREVLQRWIRGDEPPPEPVFLAAVELVLLHAAGAGRPN